jgi:glutamyl-tRNA synthetase
LTPVNNHSLLAPVPGGCYGAGTMSVRVRFAPSPTGFLHIGSVRTALFNWLYARHTGGTFILRIEDTDVARNTEQSLRTILDGLKWLGLDWDEGPEKNGPVGPYFQSQRADIYKRRVQELIAKDMAYEREGAIRFRMTRQPIEIPDLIAGGVVRPLNETEMLDPDFVIVRSDGNPVFHFVNVVDDIEMKVTHVIRGEDHLSNTPKHIALFRAFGVETPKYAHLPMILNADGTKMSKRDPDPQKARLASLESYVEDGFIPEAVRNYLCLLGYSPKDGKEVRPIEEFIAMFDLPQILRHNARFDVTKLTWMNGEYLRSLPLDRFIELARPFVAGHDDPKVLGLVKEKVKLLKELPDWTDYFFTDEFPFDPAAVQKSCSAPTTSDRLTKLADRYAAVATWDAGSLEVALKSLATELGVKAGELIHPCRVAASGKSHGPSLYHMLEVLGRDRVLTRLRQGAEKFRS